MNETRKRNPNRYARQKAIFRRCPHCNKIVALKIRVSKEN